jgi:2-methylcitrate dehydratase PrpD
MTFTDEVVSFIVGGGRSSENERPTALHAVADTLAVAAAATRTPLARTVRSSLSCSGSHALWGVDQTSTPLEAAYYNGVVAHALDFDDMSESVRGHLSSVVLPALFSALLELEPDERDAAAFRFSRAYSVAAQVAGSLAAGLTLEGHYRRGWHSTSTVGAVSSVAGIAHLIGLDPQATRNALGIAASTASGLRHNFGTDTKALHAGASASNAVRAVQFAVQGLSAGPDSLGGAAGFLRVLGEPADIDRASAALYGRPVVDYPGINIKLVPCCYELQRTANAALDLSRRLPRRIDTIRVVVNRGATEPLILGYPTSGREAQFSPRFVVAAALVLGRLDLSTFSDSVTQDERIRALAHRVTVVESDGPPLAVRPARFASVEIAGGGDTVIATVEEPPGSALIGINRDDLKSKVANCLSVIDRADLTDQLFSATNQLIYGGETGEIESFVAELGRLGDASHIERNGHVAQD